MDMIHYNTILLNRIKISILNIPLTDLIALGIFSQDTKSSIIRIFLLNMIISFLNYIGEKNDFFKSKQFNDIKSLNKRNNINYNILYSKIYDTFLSIPIQIHFSHTCKKIFKRRPLYIKDIYYKNYYLIDMSNNKIILSLETLHDKNNDKAPVLKTSSQKKLWKELLFHCQNLKNDYIKKNNMTFSGIDYQNFFVKIEYKVTYPRRNFIIKFLPLFNGMCIIHEYIQLKLSTFEGEEKKNYTEKNIIYGYDAYDNIFRNSDNRYFENEHYLLKQVHFFIIESLFCSNRSLSYFFSMARKPKIYFSEEILEIIDDEINLILKENNNKEVIYNSPNEIINKIISVLYEEYVQINNSEKIVHKSSTQISKNKEKKDLILKEIQLLDKNKSIQITKNETLIFLFNSIQYNKNINPNDITLDLNDEKMSQLRISQTENDEFPSPRRSKIIEKKQRPNSIRLSDLLSEKNSIRPSKESMKSQKNGDIKFPYDSEIKRNSYDLPLKEENDYQENESKENTQKFSFNQNNINNNDSYNNQINTNDNEIEKYNNESENDENITNNNFENNINENNLNEMISNNNIYNNENNSKNDFRTNSIYYNDQVNSKVVNDNSIINKNKEPENSEYINDNNEEDINNNNEYSKKNINNNNDNNNYSNYEQNINNDEFNDDNNEFIYNKSKINSSSSKKNLRKIYNLDKSNYSENKDNSK